MTGGNNFATLLRHAALKTQQPQQARQLTPPLQPIAATSAAPFVAMGDAPRQPQGVAGPSPAATPAPPLQLLSPAFFAQPGAVVNKHLADVRKQPALSPASSTELAAPRTGESANPLTRLFAKWVNSVCTRVLFSAWCRLAANVINATQVHGAS